MVHGKEAPFFEEARSLGNAIRKEDFDFTPVAARAGNSMGPADHGLGVFPWTVDRRSVQFATREHRRHALVGRYSLKGNALGGSESGNANVPEFLDSLNIPMNLVLRYAEIMFEYSSLP